MANSVIQTIRDAEVDARSLSEFIYNPADVVVSRRLAPSIHSLQYYLDFLDTIPSIVQNAINNTAVEDGVLADTFVTVTANGVGQIARTQRDKNSDIISVKDFENIEAAYTFAQEKEANIFVPDGEYTLTADNIDYTVFYGTGSINGIALSFNGLLYLDARAVGLYPNTGVDITDKFKTAERIARTLNKELIIQSGEYIVSSDIYIHVKIKSTGSVTFSATESARLFFEGVHDINNYCFYSCDVLVYDTPDSDVPNQEKLKGSKITGNYFDKCSLTVGSYAVQTKGVVVSNNSFVTSLPYNNGVTALSIYNTKNCLISGNSFQRYYRALMVSGESFSTHDIVISGNSLLNSSENIVLEGKNSARLSYIKIDSNKIISQSSASAGSKGLYGTYVNHFEYINNFVDAQGAGIELYNIKDGVIKGNKIRSYQSAAVGIRLQWVSDVDVVDNSISSDGHCLLCYVPYNLSGLSLVRLKDNKLFTRSNVVVKYDGVDFDITGNHMETATNHNFFVWVPKAVKGNIKDNTYKSNNPERTANSINSSVEMFELDSVVAKDATTPASVTPPVITNSDPVLGGAKSYVVEFTLGDYTNLQAVSNSANKKSLTEHMQGRTATLAWNSHPWSIATGKVPPHIVNGRPYTEIGVEDSATGQYSKRVMVIDRAGKMSLHNVSLILKGASERLSGQDINLTEKLLSIDAWQAVVWYRELIIDGEEVAASDGSLSARTVLGQKADGTYVLLVVDGKTGGTGANFKQVTDKMKALGCTNAFNLDGGGSTTLWYDGAVINTPSDSNGERAIPSFMYI